MAPEAEVASPCDNFGEAGEASTTSQSAIAGGWTPGVFPQRFIRIGLKDAHHLIVKDSPSRIPLGQLD
jgi:hypothetical protein